MMSATKSASVLQSLELDSSIIDSLPEAVLSELIGFIEYDSRCRRRDEPGAHCTQEPPVLNLSSWHDQ
jgi:hypothetical protein